MRSAFACIWSATMIQGAKESKRGRGYCTSVHIYKYYARHIYRHGKKDVKGMKK